MATKIQLGDDVSWELIYKRNKVEHLKQEKFPLDIIDELPELINKHYADIPEEDIVRLFWHGIVHDKPKTGSFMIRLKVPYGLVTTSQLKSLGLISQKYGNNYSEITTRMAIQLHEVRLKQLPEVLQAIRDSGLTTTGAEGDTVRNITSCPLVGIQPEETFDMRPLIDKANEFFTGHRKYSDLPRKFKLTITGCPHQCSGPEFHDLSLIAAIREGRRGYGVRIGGGLSSTPRLARDLRIFVPEEEALEIICAILDEWHDYLYYRISRPKSRIKFMVDDHGPDGIRQMIEKRLGRQFDEMPAPDPIAGNAAHLGVHQQKQEGKYSLGYPVPQGRVKGDQLRQLAEVLETVGGHMRFTRQQNFVLADISEEALETVKTEVSDIGFSMELNHIYGNSVACTSHKFCNYSVAKTKDKANEILKELNRRFGAKIKEGLTLYVDGCPHACGQHWMGNIGLQGTTGRTETGDKVEAYDITLRGGLGDKAAIGKSLLRRINADQVTEVICRLVEVWLIEKYEYSDSDSSEFGFQDFCNNHTDSELKAIALDSEIEEVVNSDRVTLRLSGPLLEYTGGIDRYEVRSIRAHTVDRLIKGVIRRYKVLEPYFFDENGELSGYVNLFLNDEDIRNMEGLETSLEAGDEVLVLPALSGG